MNLRDFKKIADTDDAVLFRNNKGHEIKVAKKGLSSRHLESLNKLPIHKAKGDGPVASQDDPQDGNLSPEEQADVQQFQGSESAGLQEGTPQSQGLVPYQPQEQPPAAQPLSQQIANTPTPTMPSDQPGKAMAQSTEEQPEPAPLFDSISSEMQKVSQDIINHPIQAKTYGDLLWKEKDENGELKNKSPLGKLGTFFGLLMSGAGSGLAHQENALLHMMDKTIATDLEKQKAQGERANNFYNALSNAKHLAAADDVTRMEYMQAYGRRFWLDKLRTDIVNKYPEGSPEWTRGMDVLGKLVFASDKSDVGADTRVAGLSQLYGGLPGGAARQGQKGAPSARGGQSKAVPVSQQNWDSGVDEKAYSKLRDDSKLKLPFAPTEGELDHIQSESNAIKELRAQRKAYADSFNEMDKMLFAGALNRNQKAAYENSLNAALSRVVAGRFVTNEAKSQAQGIFPDWKDYGGKGQTTRQEKFRKGLELFDNLEAGNSSYLGSRGLLTPSPHPTLDSVHEKQGSTNGKHQEGDTGIYKGKPVVYRDGKWGYQ